MGFSKDLTHSLNSLVFWFWRNPFVNLVFIPIPETTVDKSNGINAVYRRCPPHHTAVCFRRPP